MIMKDRLTYIDCLRGLCIFTVIYVHLIGFGGGREYAITPIHKFMSSFFLITFYFISGLLSYKDKMIPDLKTLGSYLIKKVRQLLLPSIVIMAAYTFLVNGNIIGMFNPFNLWVTWFTYVLFSISSMYAILLYLLYKIRNKAYVMLGLLTTAIISYQLSRINQGEHSIGSYIQLSRILYYLPFFIFGALCKMNFNEFNKLTENKYFVSLITISLLVLFHIENSPLLFKSLCLILFMYSICKKFTANVNEMVDTSYGSKTFVHAMELLGRYSLEIYFLHFLFLFRLPAPYVAYLACLSGDSCWWGQSSVGFVEFITIGPLCMLLAVACIVLSKILHCIPFVGLLMFGKK